MSDLAVCIVSWNSKASLGTCLASIPAGAGGLDCEVIVVDNASRDGSAAMVAEKFPSIRLIKNRRNRGFAAACNQAMKTSRSDYILLLNPDTEVRPDSLEEMVGFLRGRPGAGGAGGRLCNPDGSIQPSVRKFPGFKSSLGQFTLLGKMGFFRRARRDYLCRDFDYGRPRIVDQPMGAALFLSRKGLDTVGGMDEDYFLYFEEVDLCRRLHHEGLPLWYNPASHIIHWGGESTVQAGARADFWFQESQFRYFRKHRGRTATFFFSLLFKPMFLAGVALGTAENAVSLAAARIGNDRNKAARRKERLRRKWRFLRKYTLRFCLL